MALKKKYQTNIQDCILLELIKKGSYSKIIDLVAKKDIITDRDRYIYSYALLRIEEHLKALINLWPLVKKYPDLQSDCWQIGLLLFKQENFLSKVDDEKVLYMLFQIARSTILGHKIYFEIQKKLFNLYWEKKEYAKLENILKTCKKDKDGALLENLSKVNFWQYANKLSGNIFGFIGYTLTGFGCCILKEEHYHHDLEQQVKGIVDELKKIFLELTTKYKHIFLDFKVFTAFLEYESQVLIKVLEVAINSGTNLDYVGTPSYFINYDPSNILFPRFKSWLEEHDLNLGNLYELNTYNAIIGVLTENYKLLKSVTTSSLDPWILLAIKLRNFNLKNLEINQINLTNSLDLVKNILISTVKMMLDKPNEKDERFWETLIKIEPKAKNLEISYIIANKLIQDLKNQSKKCNLNLKPLQHLAKRLNNLEFTQEVELLIKRQQECIEFLAAIKNYKKSKEIINNIKDQKSLFKQISLIADLKVLVAKDLSNSLIECFNHVKRLVENSKINRIEKLADHLDLNCSCYICLKELHEEQLPYVINTLNLESISLPIPLTYIKSYEKEIYSKKSILSSEDPFVALGVKLSDPKSVIMQKTLELIKQFPEQAIKLRNLQNELFDPTKRLLHHYLRYLSLEESKFREYELLTEAIPFREEFLDGKP